MDKKWSGWSRVNTDTLKMTQENQKDKKKFSTDEIFSLCDSNTFFLLLIMKKIAEAIVIIAFTL